jgi:hypothetical protein
MTEHRFAPQGGSSSPVDVHLDHVVVNAKYRLEEFASLFRAIGFTLAPPGVHSLGSLSQTIVFRESYLELIALPPGRGDLRPEIATSPTGLNGLVFRTSDADETYRALLRSGFAPDGPRSFHRPVHLRGVRQEARFRTVGLSTSAFRAGRVYFCEHLTPELVWQPDLMRHTNGTTRIEELVVAALDPVQEAERYRALLNQTPVACGDADEQRVQVEGFAIRVLSQDRYRDYYGSLSLESATGDQQFGALVIHTANPDELLARREPWQTSFSERGTSILGIPNLRILLEIRTDTGA